MPNFKITYGKKGEEQKESIEIHTHLGEAMEQAQMYAIQSFRSSEEGQLIIEELRKKYRDPIMRASHEVRQANELFNYFAEELFSPNSEVYLVTNQLGVFDNVRFAHIGLNEAIAMLQGLTEIGLDSETTGLDVHTDDMLLLQLGNEVFQIVFDISSFDGRIPDKLKEFLMEPGRLYLLQNAKFDLKYLFKQDVILKNVYDTFLVETILTIGKQMAGRGLKDIVEKYCGVTLEKETRLEFTTVGITDRGIQYAANDVKHLPEVKEKQMLEVVKYDLQKTVDLDNVFVIALAYTEYCGIKLDYDKWLKKTANKKELLLEYRDELTRQLRSDGMHSYFSGMSDLFSGEMDCTINWNSPKQVVKLFEEYGINVEVHEKGVTKKSINADVIKPQRDEFPILKPYLKYKEMQKEVSTYGEKWNEYINSKTKRIHTTFKQINNTGRLSSGSKFDGTPNLQNLPADQETRSCFIAEPGNVLIDADYSSQEQIILANFSKEKGLLDFYAKGFTDMHSYVAFLMYEDIRRCSIEVLTPDKLSYIKSDYPEERRIAKSAGFAINYGGNGSTIAKNCNLSNKEGDFVYNSYFESFPDLKKFFTLQFDRAAHFGYIEFNPITKRKFFFDKETNGYFKHHATVSDKYFWVKEDNPKSINREYNAAKSEMQRLSQNYPIQGTAGDITKFAAVLLLREILARGWWMKVLIVNQVHDEILVEAPKEIADEVAKILVDCMERAGAPFCRILPLKADTVIAEYWVHE